MSRLYIINPIALRKAKIVYNFAFLSALGLMEVSDNITITYSIEKE